MYVHLPEVGIVKSILSSPSSVTVDSVSYLLGTDSKILSTATQLYAASRTLKLTKGVGLLNTDFKSMYSNLRPS